MFLLFIIRVKMYQLHLNKQDRSAACCYLTCFMMILATSLTVSDGHQFSPCAHMATHSNLCIGQSPLFTNKTNIFKKILVVLTRNWFCRRKHENMRKCRMSLLSVFHCSAGCFYFLYSNNKTTQSQREDRTNRHSNSNENVPSPTLENDFTHRHRNDCKILIL